MGDFVTQVKKKIEKVLTRFLSVFALLSHPHRKTLILCF